MSSGLFTRSAKKEKEPKNLCPHCGGDLGNLELYRDFNFLACPHCQEGVTPIYDLNDYIDHLIAQIDRVRGFDAGVDEYITKPHDRTQLLRVVRRLLGHGQGDGGGGERA